MPEVPFVSPSEQTVLEHLVTGAKPAEVAVQMGLHIYTVRAHIMNLRLKFNATSIAELLQRAKLPRQILEAEYEARRWADIPSSETLAAEQEQARKRDFEFYRSLGPAAQENLCKKEGCAQGAIRHSVLCRQHHYEMIQHRPCPFTGDA